MTKAIKRLWLIGVLLVSSWVVFVYPWQRLFLWSTNLSPLSTTTIVILWFLPIILFLIWMRLRTPVSALFGQVSVNWLGICIMFMWAAAFTEIIHMTGLISDQTATRIMLILGLCLCVYAIYKATHIEITNLALQSYKIKQNYKMAHLSDIHLGSRSQNFVRKVIKKTNQLKPDLIFITGDLIDMRKVKPELLHVLEEFSAPVFFIKGNHDRYIGSGGHFEVIDQTGVITLNDHHHTHEDLQIIGISDSANANQLSSSLPKITLNHERYTILLYHKPEEFELVANHKIDLMLSGHTHAGQIFPFNLVVKKQFPYLKGLHKMEKSHLYVSQGTGTWGPVMRLGSNNEIVLIELNPSNSPKKGEKSLSRLYAGTSM